MSGSFGCIDRKSDGASARVFGNFGRRGLRPGRARRERVRLSGAMVREEKKADADSGTTVTNETPVKDVVLIHGTSPDGKGLAVLRHRENRLERGLVMPIEHGKPIHGEVVTLQPRREFPLLCDVKVEYSPAEDQSVETTDRRSLAKGPGQVATDNYRTNWDRIFHSRPSSGGDLN